jgi:hypothetical protein
MHRRAPGDLLDRGVRDTKSAWPGPGEPRGSAADRLGIVHAQPRRDFAARRAPGNRPDEVECLYVAIMRATQPQGR